MKISRANQLAIAQILPLGSFFTTVAISPWFTFDPIGLIKLLTLSITGVIVGILVISDNYRNFFQRANLLLILIFLWIFDLFLILFFSGGGITQQLFGVYGRNTGLVTYLLLSLIFLAGTVLKDPKQHSKFVIYFIAAGAISTAYGFLQYIGKDPAPWTPNFNPIVGFLGNPDFQSAFLGMVSAVTFNFIFESSINFKARIANGFLTLAALFVIYQSRAIQGLLIFTILSAIAILIRIYFLRKKYIFSSGLFVGALGSIIILLGILNKGPAASFLHKTSILSRGDYWQAAWHMTITHPFFGIGLDGFGDWYRRSRSMAAILRINSEVVSDSAHNIFLDIASSGGFPFLVIYLILMFLTLKSAISFMRLAKNIDSVFISIFLGWIGFQLHSIVSINQIGIAIWGWVFSGLLLSYPAAKSLPDFHKPSNKQEKSKSMRKNKSEIESLKPLRTSVLKFAGFVLGLAIAIPPYYANAMFRAGINSGDGRKMLTAAEIWPQNPVIMNLTAQAFVQNNYGQGAHKISRDVVKRFPDDFNSWRILSNSPNASLAEIKKAKRELKRLDPLNPDL